MATLNELYDAFQNQTFESMRRKIEVALLIKAQAVIGGSNQPASRVSWAKAAIRDIENESRYMLKYLIAQYNAQSVTALSNNSDSTINTAVGTAIDVLYPAG